jgi:hypothetical protein
MGRVYVGDPRGYYEVDGEHKEAWVEVDGEREDLDPRLDLSNHSPSGFAWGYGGSGPAQLALAILADMVGDERAMKHYCRYKDEVIARLPQDRGFLIKAEDVTSFVEASTEGGLPWEQ